MTMRNASTATLNLRGVFPALVTPFSQDGKEVDFQSFERLLRHHMQAGVHGFVVCGSTGEAATLRDGEYLDVVRCARDLTRGKLPCVAGISVSATAKAVELAHDIAELGCEGVLVAAPPYNKPSQIGLIEHMRAVKAACGLSVIAYNIPGRSAVGFSPATLGLLSQEGIISGIKDATGSIDALADTMNLVTSECQVMTGDDSMTLATMAYGGTGSISACANVLPREFVGLTDAWFAGDVDKARSIQLSMLSKLRACFVESNPVPVKTVLALQGIIAHSTVRLPLVPLSLESLAKVKAEFSL
jgi:4-hydroxy-tetrahydrodipicolinate synthase